MGKKPKEKINIDSYVRDSPYGPQIVRGHERRLPGSLTHPREKKAGGKTVYKHYRAIENEINRRSRALEKLGADRKLFKSRIDQKKPRWLNPDYWRSKTGGGRRYEKLLHDDLDPDSKISSDLDKWERHANRVLKEIEDAWK